MGRTHPEIQRGASPLAHANRLWAGLSGPNREAYRDGVRSILRAYQDLREWTVEELEALPEGAVILTARNHLGVKVPEDGDGETFWEFGGWYALTEDLIGDSPIRLLFNPDDLKEG